MTASSDWSDLKIGDLVGLPAELGLGTILAVRGGPRDGDRVEHVNAGWLCNGALWIWREVFAWLVAAPDVSFVVIRAPKQCKLPGCVQPTYSQRADYCGDGHRMTHYRMKHPDYRNPGKH